MARPPARRPRRRPEPAQTLAAAEALAALASGTTPAEPAPAAIAPVEGSATPPRGVGATGEAVAAPASVAPPAAGARDVRTDAEEVAFRLDAARSRLATAVALLGTGGEEPVPASVADLADGAPLADAPPRPPSATAAGSDALPDPGARPASEAAAGSDALSDPPARPASEAIPAPDAASATDVGAGAEDGGGASRISSPVDGARATEAAPRRGGGEREPEAVTGSPAAIRVPAPVRASRVPAGPPQVTAAAVLLARELADRGLARDETIARLRGRFGVARPELALAAALGEPAP